MTHAIPNDDTDSTNTPVQHHPVVLLVDSHAMSGETLRRMLATEGDIEFHHCQDPHQAILKAIDVQPTIIFLEPFLNTPDMDGYTVLNAYRNNPAMSDTPIVMLSLQDDPHAKRRALELGATDYLVKLPDRIEIVARIRAHSKTYMAQLKRNREYTAIRELVNQLQANSVG